MKAQATRPNSWPKFVIIVNIRTKEEQKFEAVFYANDPEHVYCKGLDTRKLERICDLPEKRKKTLTVGNEKITGIW